MDAAELELNKPAGWQLCVDSLTNQYVYFNPETMETISAQEHIASATHGDAIAAGSPPRGETIDMSALAAVDDDAGSSGSNHNSSSDGEEKEEPLPPGWEEGRDKQGRRYFINHNEKTTTWDDPRQRASKAAAKPSTPVATTAATVAATTSVVDSELVERTPVAVAVTATTRLSHAPPLWDTDAEASLILSCTRCQTDFSFFKRKHACRCCYRQFCQSCCSKETDVPVLFTGQAGRAAVCEACHRHLSSGHLECIGRLFPALDSSSSRVGGNVAAVALEILDVVQRDSSSIYAPELAQLSVHKSLAALLSHADARFVAVQIVAHVARDPANLESLGEHCFTSLVNLLASSRSIDHATEVTLALQSLCRIAANQSRLCLVGGVEHLIGNLTRFRLHSAAAASLPNYQQQQQPQQQSSTSDQQQQQQQQHPPVVIATSVAVLRALADNGATLPVLQSSARLLPALIDLLSSWCTSQHPSSVALLEHATSLLDVLVADDSIKALICQQAGASASLVKALASQKGVAQMHTLSVLTKISSNDDCCRAMIDAGGVRALIAFLEAVSGVVQKQHAANILLKLCSMSALKTRVIHDLLALGNGLPIVVALVGSEDPSLRQFALLVLMSIADDAQVRTRLRDIGGIHRLVALLGHSDDGVKEYALVTLGKLSINTEENSLAILNSGGLMATVQLLSGANTTVRIEAARAIAHMSASSDKMAAAILAVGGIQSLVSLLSSPLEALKENAADALANLAKSGICREAIVSCGGVGCVVPLMASANETVQLQGLRIFQILATDAAIRDSAVSSGCLPSLVRLLDAAAPAIRTQAALILLGFTADSDANRQSILELGGVAGIVDLYARHDDPNVRLLASEVVAVWSNTPQGRESLAAAGLLPLLVRSLAATADPAVMQQHAAIALSNMTTEDACHDAIFDLGGLDVMLRLLRSLQLDRQQCACYAIGNLARHPRCRITVINKAGVGALVRLLMSPNDTLRRQAAFTLAALSKDPKVAEQIANPAKLDMAFPGEHDVAASPSSGQSSTASSSSASSSSSSSNSQSSDDSSDSTPTTTDDVPPLPTSPMAAILGLLSAAGADVQSMGVAILMNICGENSSNWQALVSQGGVPALCALLASHSHTAQRRAAEELSRLSTNAAHVGALLEPANLRLVASLLVAPELDLRSAVIGAVAQMSKQQSSWPALVGNGGLISLLELLSVDEPATQASAALALSNLSESPDVLFMIGQSNIIPRLVDLLYSTNVALQSSIARIVANLVLEPNSAAAIVNYNGIQVCVDLLSSPSGAAQESAALALGRLAHFDECRAAILASAKLPGLLAGLLSSTNSAVRSTAVLLVGILCCEPTFCQVVAASGVIAPLVALITLPSSSSSSSLLLSVPSSPSKLGDAAKSTVDDDTAGDLPPPFAEAVPTGGPAPAASDADAWKLRHDAVATLLRLAGSATATKTAIVQASGLAALLALVQSPSCPVELQELAVACVAQLASMHTVKKSFRDLGGLKLLRGWLVGARLQISASQLIVHLALDSAASSFIGSSGVLAAAVQLLGATQNRELLLNLLQALASLLLHAPNQEVFRSSNGWATVAQFFAVDDPELRLLCANVVKTLAYNPAANAEHIIASGILSLFVDLLAGPQSLELLTITLLEILITLVHCDAIRPQIIQLLTVTDALTALAHQNPPLSIRYLGQQLFLYIT